jgi:hypothetical protein
MGGIFYLNGDSRQLRYLDYLDKLDRAYKFGYPVPVNPYFDDNVPAPEPVVTPPNERTPRWNLGGGLGWFRRR